MSTELVLDIGRNFFYTVAMLALPALLVSLVVGLIIALFQTVTSIQEQTLAFAPRLIAVGIVLAFTMAWSIQVALQFTRYLFLGAAEWVR